MSPRQDDGEPTGPEDLLDGLPATRPGRRSAKRDTAARRPSKPGPRASTGRSATSGARSGGAARDRASASAKAGGGTGAPRKARGSTRSGAPRSAVDAATPQAPRRKRSDAPPAGWATPAPDAPETADDTGLLGAVVGTATAPARAVGGLLGRVLRR